MANDPSGVSTVGWERMHHMPVALRSHGCTAATIKQSSGIVVTGGKDNPNGDFFDRAFFYDVALDLWTHGAHRPGGGAKKFLSISVLGSSNV